jgi:hypothetical protein
MKNRIKAASFEVAFVVAGRAFLSVCFVHVRFKTYSPSFPLHSNEGERKGVIILLVYLSP